MSENTIGKVPGLSSQSSPGVIGIKHLSHKEIGSRVNVLLSDAPSGVVSIGKFVFEGTILRVKDSYWVSPNIVGEE